jgi:tripartite-type tricarboxylate transporter receptor subunit TctC
MLATVAAGFAIRYSLFAQRSELTMKQCRRRFTAALFLPALLWAGVACAQAAKYPEKAVTMITDAGPGSAPDVVARFVADGLGAAWHQQVVVVPRPGANGSIAARAAAEAAPDGYTLYDPALSTFVAQKGIAPNIPVELPRDFLAIGFLSENPMFVAVNPSLGVHSLPQLIARAKAQPGTISYAVTGVGRLTHLTGELLQKEAGIKLLMVPYTAGLGNAISDVVGGRVNMIIEGYSGIAAAIRARQIEPIAVASMARLPEFPDLPTVAETIPGFAASGWQILAAPLGTAEPILRKVSDDLARVVSDPEFKKKLAALGSYSRAMSPGETTKFVQDEQRKWNAVLEQIARSQ